MKYCIEKIKQDVFALKLKQFLQKNQAKIFGQEPDKTQLKNLLQKTDRCANCKHKNVCTIAKEQKNSCNQKSSLEFLCGNK